MLNIHAISIIVMISYTITISEIFTEFREYIASYGNYKLTYLINCPYCLSFWVTLIVTSIQKDVNYFFSYWMVSAIICLLIKQLEEK